MNASSPTSEQPLSSSPRAPLTLLLLGLLLGLPLGQHLPNAPPSLLAIGSIAIAAAALQRLQRSCGADATWKILIVFSTTLLACCWAGIRLPTPPRNLLELPPREATLTLRMERIFPVQSDAYISAIATIIGTPPHLSAYQQQRLYLSAQPPTNSIMVTGSQLPATGVLHPIDRQQAVDFEQYLLNQQVFFRLQAATLSPVTNAPQWSLRLHQWQQRIIASLQATAFTPQASDIPLAMLLGRKDFLQEEWKQRFILTGIMHLFAVSGMHVGIVATTIVTSFRLLRICLTASLRATAVCLLPYILMIGAPPSAVRAYLLFLLFVIASLIRRQPQPFSALIASACLVLIVHPSLITSAGFQLSYCVVTALFLQGLPLRKQLRDIWKVDQKYPFTNWHLTLRQRFAGALIDLFAISFAASLASAPLVAVYFGNFSIGSILLNMIVVPIASLAIVLSVMLTAIGFTALPTPFYLPLAILNSILVESMLVLSEWAATIPVLFYQTAPLPGSTAALISALFFASLLFASSRLSNPAQLHWHLLPTAITILPLIIHICCCS